MKINTFPASNCRDSYWFVTGVFVFHMRAGKTTQDSEPDHRCRLPACLSFHSSLWSSHLPPLLARLSKESSFLLWCFFSQTPSYLLPFEFLGSQFTDQPFTSPPVQEHLPLAFSLFSSLHDLLPSMPPVAHSPHHPIHEHLWVSAPF